MTLPLTKRVWHKEKYRFHLFSLKINLFLGGPIMCTHRCIALLSALILSGLPVSLFAAPLPPLPPIPASTQIDADNLSLATRAALVCGARYLLSDIETNETGYLVPPLIIKQIKEYQEKIPIELHYRKVIVPLKKPVYEKYETMGTTKEGQSTDATRKIQKLTKQRIIGWEDTGKTQERLVLDPNGPIVEQRFQYKNPIYESKITWPNNFLGLNGMALYALLKSGSVEQDGWVKTAIRTLDGDLTLRGIPDTTFDLAWLVAAFSLVNDKEFFTNRDRMISKLLDGQIVESPGRGLWGPVSIRTDLLAAMISHERNLADRWDKAKAKLKELPDNKSRLKSVQDAESAFRNFQVQYKPITQHGLRFETCTERLIIGLSKEDTVILPGLPFYFYTQNLGDIENTALALFALREAAKNNCLPKTVWRPLGATQSPVLQPEPPNIILARAANAIATRQRPDGSWDQCNVHQTITAFAPLGFPPLAASEVFNLPSSATPLAALQGANAFIAAGQIVGMAKLAEKFKSNLDRALENRLKIAQNYITVPPATFGPAGLGHPFDLYQQLAEIHLQPGNFEEERRDLWAQIAVQVLNQQKDDGGWISQDVPTPSSSVLEFRVCCGEDNRSIHNERNVRKKDKDFNPVVFRRNFLAHRNNQMEGRAYSTASAMIFLLGGLREPVFGSLAIGSADSSGPIPAQALQLVNRNRRGAPATLIRVTRQTPASFINRLPVLYVQSSAEGLDSIALEVIKRYVSGAGFLVLSQPAEAATDFATQWTALIPGSKNGKLPATSPFLKNQQTVSPDKIIGLYGAEGQLTGILLNIALRAQPAGGAVSPQQAALLVSLASREYSSDTDPAPGQLLPPGDDPFVVRIGAIDLLNARPFDRSKLTQAPPAPAANPTPHPPAEADESLDHLPSPPIPPPSEEQPMDSRETPAALAPAVGNQSDEKW
jgi:hypothetical protein